MPFFRIETNVSVDGADAVVKEMSALASELLGKPEAYVMAELDAEKNLIFGGSADPAAFVTLDSLGLPEERTAELSAAICDFLTDRLSVPADRVFIRFGNPERHMFGWNGGTF